MITLMILLGFIALIVCVALIVTVGGIFIIPLVVDILVLWLLFHKKKNKKE